jgi:hypothetical protein
VSWREGSPEDPHSIEIDPPADKEHIIISWQDSVPVPRQDLVLVRRQDLERIEKRIATELNPRRDYLQNLAVSLLGTAAGIACAIPQLMTSPPLSSWVVPVFIVVPSALFLVGLILALIDHNLRGTRKEDTLSISQEIRELQGKESQYHVNHTGNGALSE